MDYQDEIKAVTVRVCNGSGVIVKPLSSDCFFILTAYHVVKDKNKDTITIDVNPSSLLCGKRLRVLDVKYSKDYDAAIVVIEKTDDIIAPYYPSNEHNDGQTHWHSGYPNNVNDSGVASCCKLHDFNRWLGKKEDGFVEYKYPNHIEQKELDGMSGGGIFDCDYHLIGVHKGLAESEDNEQLGKNIMVPWCYFEQIITDNQLPPIARFDLTSFQTFKNAIFNFDHSQGAKVKLHQLLATMAVSKSQMSGLSPLNCYDAFQKSRNVERYTNGFEMNERDWVLFGEFLLAIKVIYDFDLINRLDNVFSKFQYIQSDRDFDIYNAPNILDPSLLGVVNDSDVVFVVGGLKSQKYPQDVRQKDVLDISVGKKTQQGFDISSVGRDVMIGFTYVNANLFKDAMEENTDIISSFSGNKLECYKDLICSRI
jgi:hypothetical protein